MLLVTTEVLPSNTAITEIFPMVQVTTQSLLSQPGILKRLLGNNSDGAKDGFMSLAAMAPKNANAIIGIRCSTVAQQFSNGIFLVFTYTGTPVVLSQRV